MKNKSVIWFIYECMELVYHHSLVQIRSLRMVENRASHKVLQTITYVFSRNNCGKEIEQKSSCPTLYDETPPPIRFLRINRVRDIAHSH
mgnify:FL=1